MRHIARYSVFVTLLCLLSIIGIRSFADTVYPDKPNPPRLVNDYAHILKPEEAAQLEAKLEDFARNTSTRITIVTIKNLGGNDVEEYSVGVFNRWGLGAAGKNNGVLMLVSMDDHKAWITVGTGLEGVLTDAKSGMIFRNEIQPQFRQQKYFAGLSQAADAIIAVTKGEYKGDANAGKNTHFPVTGVIILLIIIVIIIRSFGGGSGGGGYMSGRGFGNFATGWFLGNMLGGGFGRGGGDWGGGNGDGGGFGGFGGGRTGGGGAGGSW